MSTRKLAAASLANLLIPLSGLVVSPFLARELGPEGRGLYAALTLPIVVWGWLGTYGLQDSLTYHVGHGRLSGRGAAKVGLAAAVPLGVTGTALLAAVGLFIFAEDRIHYGQFLVLALFAPLHILANLLIGALTGASDISGVNLVKVAPALLRTAVVIVACLAFDLSAFWAGLLFLASVAAGLVPGLARLWRNRTPTGGAAPSADVVPTTGRAAISDGTAAGDRAAPAGYPVRSLVAYSLACLPGVLAAISSARLDQIVGLPVIGAEQLGYYAVAVSVAEIPLVIGTAARTVLMGRPVAADPRDATRAARFAVAASVVGCGLLAAAAPVAVPWVFGGAFAPAVLPAVILCAGTTLYTCVLIFTAVLLVGGRPGHSSAALVAGSILGIIMLLVLAPLGAAGAAIASVFGYGLSLAVAAWAVHRTPQPLRMLTIPYRDDMRIARNVLQVRTRTAIGVAVTVVRRIGPANLAVALLIVLAWLRVAAPSVVHMFTAGRPAFNSPDAVPAAADALGDVISLAFIAGAAVLAASGLWPRTAPAGTRRPARLRWLAVVLAPLISIALAGLLNGQVPGLVSLALPLAAVAVWLRPPEPRVLATIGVLGAVTAAGSVLMALVRPDLALLSGAAAGAKSGMPGGLLAGPYPHSNVLGISLALSLPFVLHIGHNLARRGCLAAMLLALAWTGSRTAQLAAAAVLLSYLLIRRHPARIWPLVAPVVAGAVLIVALPLVTRDPEAFTDRGRIWQALLDRWADRPLLGWGPDVFDRPELARELGGRFNHGHNVMVHLLVIGGLVTAVLFAGLLYVAWRRSLAFARAGMAAAALFLVALVHVSWLEASHVSTTLAGYLTWLPLVLIVRLGTAPPAARARRADGSRGAAAQKMTVSRM